MWIIYSLTIFLFKALNDTLNKTLFHSYKYDYPYKIIIIEKLA